MLITWVEQMFERNGNRRKKKLSKRFKNHDDNPNSSRDFSPCSALRGNMPPITRDPRPTKHGATALGPSKVIPSYSQTRPSTWIA